MKTIALIDIDYQGHHNAFMRLFTQTLLQLGYKVIVLMPQKELIDNWLKENHPEYLKNYHSLEFSDINKEYKIFGKFNYTFSVLAKWKNLYKYLKKAEKQYNIKIDLVFFAWLDTFLANYLAPPLLNFYFPYTWVGLYFHPWYIRLSLQKLNQHPNISEIDSILMSKKCKGIAIHDEGIIDTFKKRLINKKVILFPEIADDTPPNPHFHLTEQIKQKANGRTIVGMIGFTHYKGLLTLIKIAKQINPNDFYFVFAGKWSKSGNQNYSQENIKEANLFFENPPENTFVYLNYIQEGADFNALFNSFDIPFLVYDNFPSSSNNLTKASIFEKLVIASEGFCIGDDVKKYQLGLLVPQKDVERCIEVLYRLKEKNHSLKPRFEDYRNLHSLQSLEEKFIDLLEK